ncbi:unnamed protein product [Closterium sp. Naga37s-1]|nr:unnamed protein product [Closterium sp. Naga37s-1]
MRERGVARAIGRQPGGPSLAVWSPARSLKTRRAEQAQQVAWQRVHDDEGAVAVTARADIDAADGATRRAAARNPCSADGRELRKQACGERRWGERQRGGITVGKGGRRTMGQAGTTRGYGCAEGEFIPRDDSWGAMGSVWCWQVGMGAAFSALRPSSPFPLSVLHPSSSIPHSALPPSSAFPPSLPYALLLPFPLFLPPFFPLSSLFPTPFFPLSPLYPPHLLPPPCALSLTSC